MKSLLTPYKRRARPLLGTVVEISIFECPDSDSLIEDAFNIIERIHKLMSPYDDTSDISKINQSAWSEPLRVDSLTYEVLSIAEEINRSSEGVFDISSSYKHKLFSNRDRYPIVLLPENMVSLEYPVEINLSGIAKGFAVDKAVEFLTSSGVVSGIVNAGGDLRCFGSYEYPLFLREPSRSTRYLNFISLHEKASATSSPCLPGENVSRIYNGKTGREVEEEMSVTVLSRSCVIADALTKVALHGTELLPTLLRRFSSEAFLMKASEIFYFEYENEKTWASA